MSTWIHIHTYRGWKGFSWYTAVFSQQITHSRSGKELKILLPCLLWHGDPHCIWFWPWIDKYHRSLQLSFLVLPPKSRPKGINFQLNVFCSVLCLSLLAVLVCLLLSGIIQLFLKFFFVPTTTFLLSPFPNKAWSSLPTMLMSHDSWDFPFPCFPLIYHQMQVANRCGVVIAAHVLCCHRKVWTV